MLPRTLLAALALTLATTASCGGDAPSTGDGAAPTTPAESEVTDAVPATEAADDAPADIEVLGEPSAFEPATGAEPIAVSVAGRECVLAEPLFGSCRAATGAGGAFVVTAEGDPDSPSEWNVVARCGLTPATPGASASGEFTPVMADLALAPYGEVAGVTLIGPDGAVAALVYQAPGTACPVVWGLGDVDRRSIFTGGTDALNGEESPLRFRDAEGADACAVADGEGGVTVGVPDGAGCRT
jgi:hypothetical protein